MRTPIVLLPLFVLLALAVPAFADTTQTTFYSGHIVPDNEVPPITGDSSSADALITIVARRDSGGVVSSATVYFDIEYQFGAPVRIEGLHIHQGPVGVNGPIRIDTGISAANPVLADGQGNIFRVVEVTASSDLIPLTQLLNAPAGFYINLHTAVNAGGYMRAQLQTTAHPAPVVSLGGIVNNASFAPNPAPTAPGSIAAIFGKYLNDGSTQLSSSFGADGKLITTLGGTSVTVNGIPAPIFYSTFTQLGIQIPAELVNQTSAVVQVTVAGLLSVSRTVPIDFAAPGIFTVAQNGSGPAAVLHQDGVTPVTAANPARPNEIIIIFGTGLGATDPPLGTGVPSNGNRTTNTPVVTIDGVPAAVDFSGRAPGFVGLDQINARVPANARSGALPLVISIQGRQSNSTTLAVGSAALNPTPTITALQPETAYAGDPPTVVAINGTGFLPESTVKFNGVDKTPVFVSDTRLTISLSAAELSSPASCGVTVTNPAPGGGTSNTAFFSIINAPVSPYPYDY